MLLPLLLNNLLTSGGEPPDPPVTSGSAWKRYQAYRADHPEAAPVPRKRVEPKPEPVVVAEPIEAIAAPPEIFEALAVKAAPVDFPLIVPVVADLGPMPKPKPAKPTWPSLIEMDNDFLMLAARLMLTE